MTKFNQGGGTPDEFAGLRMRIAVQQAKNDYYVDRATSWRGKLEAFTARRRLARLVKARKNANEWPPRDLDDDPELLEAVNAAAAEERHEQTKGVTFQAAVALDRQRRARHHTTGVLARCARHRAHKLEARREVLRNKLADRGLL